VLFGGTVVAREQVARSMTAYARGEVSRGEPLRAIVRHMLGLFHGEPEARRWRRMLSDAEALARNDPSLILCALGSMSPTLASA